MMKIVFRVDSSTDIGLGHVIRCLAVAKELCSNNNVVFATMKDTTNSYIQNLNYKILLKEKDETEEAFLLGISVNVKPDVIVIDKKYPYQLIFLNRLRENGSKIVMIDIICKGMSAADEIIFPAAHLDENLLREYLSQDQIDNVKTGPEYVIIRDEILGVKNQVNHSLHIPPKIVVTTGGTDPEGVLLKLIPWLKKSNLNASFLLLIGQKFKFRDYLDDLSNDLPDNISIMPYSLSELIKGDLVICTFGVSIYEMVYLQIPTICISHSMENANGARILKERYEIIKDVGYVGDIDLDRLSVAILTLLEDRISYLDMIKRCDNLIDGKGAMRVGEIITNT